MYVVKKEYFQTNILHCSPFMKMMAKFSMAVKSRAIGMFQDDPAKRLVAAFMQYTKVTTNCL